MNPWHETAQFAESGIKDSYAFSYASPMINGGVKKSSPHLSSP